jgi:hypothetical protein
VDRDHLPVEVHENLDMDNEHHQHHDKKNKVDTPESVLVFHPHPSGSFADYFFYFLPL